MLTVAEAAKRLNISKSLMYELIRKGLIEAFRIRGAIRLSESAIREYLDGCKTGKATKPAAPKNLKHLRL